MTKFSLSDISHLATLSGLTLTDSEAEQLRSSLDSVIGYVGMLDELDVEGIEPVYQVTDLYNVHEDDEIIDDGVGRDQLLSLAPDSANGQIKVPKVL